MLRRILVPSVLAVSLLVGGLSAPALAADDGAGAAAPAGAADAAAQGAGDAAAKGAGDAAEKAAAGSKSIFKSVLSGFATNLSANVFSLGFNYLIGLAFPGPNYQQELQNIQQSINQGFTETSAELATVESALDNLANQLSTNEALTAQVLCQEVRNQADGYVQTIQQAYGNYKTALSPEWAVANLSGQRGLSVLTAVGNQTFGAGTGTPSFIAGLTSVSQATQSLGNLLVGTTSAPGIIPACADAIASTVVLQAAEASNPQPVGTLETQYFRQLQQVTATYVSWVNLGASLSIVGGSMAVLETEPLPPSSAQQAASVCVGAIAGQIPGMLTCGGILAFANRIDTSVDNAWNATGAGWGQATNGTVATALREDPSTGIFSGQNTPWLIDIATYGNGSLLKPRFGAALNSSTTPSVDDPRVVDLTGVTPGSTGSLRQGSWESVPFAPASSDDWDALLGLENAPFYPDAGTPTTDFTDCLADPSNNNSVTSCVDPQGVLANRVAATSLLNAGSAVGGDLILYTGEVSTWNAQVSSFPAAIAYYDNSGFPADVPKPTVATYLDTSSLMVAGRSAAINNPAAEAGDLTSSDMYPFASNSNGIGNTIQTNVTAVMTLSRSAAPGAGQSTGVQCSDGSYPNGVTGQTLVQFLNGGGLLTSGSTATLYCEGNGWAPPGKSAGTPVLSTGNSSFYAQPQLFLAFADNWSNENGMWVCSSTANTNPPTAIGTTTRGLPCPDNPWTITTASNGNNSVTTTDQPGWMISAGSGASVAPEAHFGWPVVDVDSPACQQIPVTQGTTQQINAPALCASVFAPYAAARFGLDSGPLSVVVEPAMGPRSVSQSVNVAVVNTSTASESAGVSIGLSGGLTVNQPLSVMMSSGTRPATALNGCTVKPVGKRSVVTCRNVVFPAGTSTLQVAVSGTASTVDVALAGNGNYATAEAVVVPGLSSTTSPPALVTQLGASVSSSGSGETVSLSWVVPSSPTPITGYVIQARKPDGTVNKATVPASKVSVNNGVATVSQTLGEAGFWTVSVAAQNQNGVGDAAIAEVNLGDAPPPAPQNLTAKELPNARVLLTWSPINASPPLDSYAVAGLSPSGTYKHTDVTAFASYVTPPLPETGLWTFWVEGRNGAGMGASSVVRVSVLGSVPAAPAAVAARIGAGGSVDVSWSAPATAVPPPTSYNVAVYAPTTGSTAPTAVASMSVPSTGLTSMTTIPAMYQLGSNSPTGVWTVVVQAVNATGAGTPARASFVVTSGLKRLLSAEASLVQDILDVPIALQDIEAAECAAGVVSSPPVTGTCVNRVFTPASG